MAQGEKALEKTHASGVTREGGQFHAGTSHSAVGPEFNINEPTGCTK